MSATVIKPVARKLDLWRQVLARCMAVLDVKYSTVRALAAFDDCNPAAALLLEEVVRAHKVITHLLQNGPVGCGDWLRRLRQVPLFARGVFAHV